MPGPESKNTPPPDNTEGKKWTNLVTEWQKHLNPTPEELTKTLPIGLRQPKKEDLRPSLPPSE